MQYGHFDDERREYVITTPKTPYPWINYLGSREFFSLISNTAGGYSFYKDARLRRITRYRYNNVPLDMGGGRYFYVKDGEDFWSPGWAPAKRELDLYECRHGMGYTSITGKRGDVRADVTFFVPKEDNCEVHRVTLTNEGTQKKNLKLFSYIEWCLWDAYDDMSNYQRNLSTGEVELEGSTIYHKTEYKERRDHFAFYTVNAPIAGFDTDRESFLGTYGGYGEPQVVVDGKATDSVADGWHPIASHMLEIELEPGESKEYVFLLGYIENPVDDKWEDPNRPGMRGPINKKRAHALMEKYKDSASVQQALDELAAYWDGLLGNYQVVSGESKMDRMVNIWNQYQCMVTFNLSRSASYFETGIGRGMGFRDSNQDILGFVHQVPERARERLLDLAATQLPDGGAYHQYQPLTKKGNDAIGGNFNDDPLWLILAVVSYIKETGDYSILKEQVPFDNKDELAQPMAEHLRRSLNHVLNNLGPHGLPLIGRADWNDCLNLNCFSTESGESFQTTTSKDGKVAESVMIAGMFTYIGSEYAKLMKLTGDEEEARRTEEAVAQMRDVIMEHGYDGEWFLRAYDDFGRKIGSKECEEGKIFIESQGLCIMGGCGVEDGKAAKALESVEKYLDTQYGIVLLNPAYTKYYVEYGEISTYPAGYKENAGIFCHNNAWIICAEALMGHGEKAFEYYSKIAPAFVEERSDLYRLEPYVYAQMVAGKDARRFGEAKNSWLTGTAAWNFVAVSQYILGVKPDYDGIRMEPAIPAEWDGYKIRRRFREDVYEIEVKNPNHVCSGITSLVLDGKELAEAAQGLIPYQGDGKVHQVSITLG